MSLPKILSVAKLQIFNDNKECFNQYIVEYTKVLPLLLASILFFQNEQMEIIIHLYSKFVID